MRRRSVGLAVLLGVLLVAGGWFARPKPPPPAGDAVPPPRGGALPPAPPGQGGVRLTVNLVDRDGDRLHAVGPEGEVDLPVAPHALEGLALTSGETVSLECGIASGGGLIVKSARPHTGLGLWYGSVVEITDTSVRVRSVLGERAFTVNAWSDMPQGLVAGEYVAVKHYTFDGGQAVLNTRRFPGKVEETGVVTTAATDGSLLVQTLGGVRRYPAGSSATVAPGQAVVVAYHRTRADPYAELSVQPVEGPLTFIGKMSAFDEHTRVFSMVDAWSGVLGIVLFDLPEGPPPSIVPGDLVSVTYAWAGGAHPRATVLEERTLSTVYFGRITELSSDVVALVTLQNQPKRLVRTPDTWLPGVVQVGDMADVIWRADPAGGPPVALVVVKE